MGKTTGRWQATPFGADLIAVLLNFLIIFTTSIQIMDNLNKSGEKPLEVDDANPITLLKNPCT